MTLGVGQCILPDCEEVCRGDDAMCDGHWRRLSGDTRRTLVALRNAARKARPQSRHGGAMHKAYARALIQAVKTMP